MKIDIRKSTKKIQVSWKSDKTDGNLHEDHYTFLSYLAYSFLEGEMFQTKRDYRLPPRSRCCIIAHKSAALVSDNSRRENQNTHFVLSVSPPPFPPKIMPDSPQMTIRRSDCVILRFHATVVTRTHLTLLYVHRPPCYLRMAYSTEWVCINYHCAMCVQW